MNDSNIYHRTGEPGGPGCPLSALEISYKSSSGETVEAHLLDAGKESTELEMLRSIAQGLGVQWGQDDLGWWAVVDKN